MPQSQGSGVERFAHLLEEGLVSAGFEPVTLSVKDCGVNSAVITRIRPLVAWLIGRRVNKEAREEDIIVCNGYFSWNARRRRSIVVYHGTEKGRAVGTLGNQRFLRWLMLSTMGVYLDSRAGRGRSVVAVSSKVAAEVERWYGHGVTQVIPNAVDLNHFRPRDDRDALRQALGLPLDKFLVLYVGPNDPRKGIEMILEDIRPRSPDKMHFVMRTELSKKYDKVTKIGRLSVDDLAKLYSCCDALILPSSYEGCSITLVEALASGLPSVISDTGAADDIRRSNALKPYIVMNPRPDEYLGRLRRLCEDGQERQRVSQAAREFAVETHSLPQFHTRYHEVLAKAAKE